MRAQLQGDHPQVVQRRADARSPAPITWPAWKRAPPSSRASFGISGTDRAGDQAARPSRARTATGRGSVRLTHTGMPVRSRSPEQPVQLARAWPPASRSRPPSAAAASPVVVTPTSIATAKRLVERERGVDPVGGERARQRPEPGCPGASIRPRRRRCRWRPGHRLDCAMSGRASRRSGRQREPADRARPRRCVIARAVRTARRAAGGRSRSLARIGDAVGAAARTTRRARDGAPGRAPARARGRTPCARPAPGRSARSRRWRRDVP